MNPDASVHSPTINESRGRSFFYSQIPMLLVDHQGVVLDTNCALRELLRTDVAGCKGYSYKTLQENLGDKLVGNLFPQSGVTIRRCSDSDTSPHALEFDDIGVAEGECQYRSPHFGHAKLSVSEIPWIDTETGNHLGAILSLQLLALDKQQDYRQWLKKRWTHELMWEVYAASYDRIQLELPFYLEVVERHLTAMTKQGMKNVLDVGAGTGNVTIRLLERGLNVTAVDVGRAMLQKLFSKQSGESTNRLTVIEDTAERLPHLRDASFDGVTVLLAFFDMEDPFDALAETRRLLRPGGTLIVTDPKSCFDVNQLMAAAEREFSERGLMSSLSQDWKRIQTVAPIVSETIRMVQHSDADSTERPAWNAEVLFDLLRKDGYLDVTLVDSHLGNCATITAVKPA